MSGPFSITVGVIGILSHFYHVYSTIRGVSRDWAEADIELAKFDIRIQVAIAAANHNLQELDAPPDGNPLSPQAKEIRSKCATILETLLRRCEEEMVSLGERARRPMSAGEKVKWVVNVKEALERCTNDLQKWNEQTKEVLHLGVRWAYPPISSSREHTVSPRIDGLWVETLAQMAVARARHLHQVESDGLWVNPDELEFEQTPTRPAFTRIDLGFMRHQKLKLRPRRFGYRVRADGEKEPIMVEFREYYQKLRAERPGEYEVMRSSIMELAYMLRCASSNNGTGEENVSFPSVPLVGFSELPENTPPCFLLVYSWSEVNSLSETIAGSSQKPSPADRLKIAIDLGKSLFAFHTTGYVHGLLNSNNIFLSAPNDQTTRPLLAGFDISRSKSNGSKKLDVKDSDARIYLHPDRLVQGQGKDANHAPYDVYSLGVIWLEIGLWLPLRKLKGMKRETSDSSRRKKVFRACQSERLREEMGVEYVNAIRYCLQEEFLDGSVSQAPSSAAAAGFMSVFGEPNAAQAVAMLPIELAPVTRIASEGSGDRPGVVAIAE